VESPDRQHVRGVAAADVDHVLLEQERIDGLAGADEQRQVARLGLAGEAE
jgi:hypothetical protein